MYASIYGGGRNFFWKGGAEIRRLQRELEKNQWLSREEIEEIQLFKIQRLLKHAYENVPFYRSRFQQERIQPEEIRSLKDFSNVPVLTREDVIEHKDLLMARGFQGKTFEDRTGGSTGQPMRFLMDDRTTWWSAAVEARYRGWYGVRPGDKRAWVWGALKDFPQWNWKDRLKARVKRYRYLNAHTMSKANMNSFTEMLRKWEPAMIRAYPSALSLFAFHLKDEGVRDIRPRLVELSGEKLFPWQRELFEEIFKAPVADHYSSWEIYDIAYSCPAGGRHISEDRYLEIISEGGPVRAGQPGEMIITSLNQYAMPFIRYRNGDFGVAAQKRCSCGRGLPLLKEVVGRSGGLIVRPDGQPVHGAMFDYVLREVPEVLQFQVHQGDLTRIEIRLVLKQSLPKDLVRSIEKKIQAFFGEEMKIVLTPVDRIELTAAGKLRTLISEVRPSLPGIKQASFDPETYIKGLNGNN